MDFWSLKSYLCSPIIDFKLSLGQYRLVLGSIDSGVVLTSFVCLIDCDPRNPIQRLTDWHSIYIRNWLLVMSIWCQTCWCINHKGCWPKTLWNEKQKYQYDSYFSLGVSRLNSHIQIPLSLDFLVKQLKQLTLWEIR